MYIKYKSVSNMEKESLIILEDIILELVKNCEDVRDHYYFYGNFEKGAQSKVKFEGEFE